MKKLLLTSSIILVVFLIYLITLIEVKWKDIFISAIIMTACILLINLYKGFNFDGMALLINAYAVIISIMLGKSIGNYITNKNAGSSVIMLGALLFFISDVMLVFDNFANISPVFDYLCLATYYPGVFLMATGLLLQGKTANINQKTQNSDK